MIIYFFINSDTTVAVNTKLDTDLIYKKSQKHPTFNVLVSKLIYLHTSLIFFYTFQHITHKSYKILDIALSI